MSTFDFSKVPESLLSLNINSSTYFNAGILRNIGLCKTDNALRKLDFETNTSILEEKIIFFSKLAESKDLLPEGSTEILNDIIKQFLESSSYKDGIKIWEDYLIKLKDEGNYDESLLVAILSIGYYSAQFWAYVTKHNKKIKFSIWLQIVCTDLKRALSGAQIGIEISKNTGIGIIKCAVYGAIIGDEL